MRRYLKYFNELIFIVACLFYVNVSLGQDHPLKGMPIYYDYSVVKSFEDSLQKEGVDSFLTFLTREQDNNFTYFVWIKEGFCNIIRITDSNISEPKSVKWNPFTNERINSLAILESECQLKLQPPFVDPKKCEVVFITIKSRNYIVEVGPNSDYQLAKKNTEYRNHFFENIKTNLMMITDSWKPGRRYNRALALD